MTRKTPFGRRMREDHFLFAPTFKPLNHGSFGTIPRSVLSAQTAFRNQEISRPDKSIVYDLPDLIDGSRAAVAPLLGASVDEVVLVPNATIAVNTVLRNLPFEKGDVIVYFSTIYDACEKTISAIGELNGVIGEKIQLDYPVEDEVIVERFMQAVVKLKGEGRRVKLAMFDTVLTFPGARIPWENLTIACKKLGVLSLIDGAHGIGHIDLTHLGAVKPDFFVSNCHKWLYTPRSCAVFYVPKENQHLIRTSIPTSHGYQYPSQKSIPEPPANSKSRFALLFEFIGTLDYTPYLCIPAALKFRQEICGGEEKIRSYCWDLARLGGIRVAEILGTERMDNATGTLGQCCFANVRLPLAFKTGGTGEKGFDVEDAERIKIWINKTALESHDTYLQVAFLNGHMWVRLSAQVYLELEDFDWVGKILKALCGRLIDGESF